MNVRLVPCVLLLAASASLLVGCKKEPTRWNLAVRLPVVEDSLTWDDVLEGTGAELVEGEEGAVLVWKGTLGTVAPGDLLTLPDTTILYAFSPEFAGGPFPVPPGVTLFEQAEDIDFAGIEAALRGAVLEAGVLRYRIESTVDGAVAMRYDLPGVSVAGGAVVLEEVLEPGPGEDRAVREGVVDLAGAEVDFTGVSGLDVNRMGSLLTVGTPADILDTAAIYGVDSVRIALSFEGVRVREVVGYFGDPVEDWQFDAELVDRLRFPSGFIDFEAARARLVLVNRLGADLRMQLDALRVDGTLLQMPVLGQPILLARADVSGPEPVPTKYEIDLLRARPYLPAVLGGLPAKVHGRGTVALNPLGDITGGNDYLHADYLPSCELELEVPLRIGLEGITFRDTVELGAIAGDGPAFSGFLEVEFASTFPVALTVAGSWVGEDGVPFAGEVPAFVPGWGLPYTLGTVRIPVSSALFAAPSALALEAVLATSGRVELTGKEVVRIRVRVEVEG